MNVFDYRPPSPVLREYVRLFQIIGLSFQASTVVPVKPYWPRPENCLAFYPRGGDTVGRMNGVAKKNTRSTLFGQHTSLIVKQPIHDFVLFQIVFQPGALFRLTGIPSHELTNTFLDAETVFSPEIHLVNERLSSTDNHLEMIEIVEIFLMHLISRQCTKQSRFSKLPIDKVGQFMLQNPARYSLDWMAGQACLSTKQFYNLFVQRMGVSPKLYARIARFDKTVKLKNANPSKDWLGVALDLGYCDYQHLVRDYKEFTNLTPTEFNQKESSAPERAFGNAET